jgi:hypothetical protein
MKKLNIIIYKVAAFILFLFFICYFFVFIKYESNIVYIKPCYNTTFNPLEDFDFDTGDNVAYLVISMSDIRNLPIQMRKCTFYECRENVVLDNLRKHFYFEIKGGDMATCQSKLYIYKNGRKVFCSNILIMENTIGIQNQFTGWANSKNKDELKKIFNKFSPKFKLII